MTGSEEKFKTINMMKKHLTLLGIAAVATAVFAGCSKDELVESYQGEEISFSTRVATRATSLTLDNLGDFAVIAKGVHPSGDLYTQYLIGEENGGNVEGEKAHWVSNTNWELDRKVYWPSGMNQILFWAYTTKNRSDKPEDPVLSSGTISFNQQTGAAIKDFSPAKEDLAQAHIGTGNWNDGNNQKDLLVAFTEQQRAGGVSIKLEFSHALSQIDIVASQKDRATTDHRRVKVRGAWIVNVKTKGTLDAGFTWNKIDKEANVIPEWKDLSDLGMYGSYTSQEYVLGNSKPQAILGNNGSLMIVPQVVSKWNPQNSSEEQGAYILLLCRVELEHDGTFHEGSDIGDIKIDNGKHYHQLFPVSDKYDDKEYGFSCVPLDIAWEMGKSYTYNLDICGENSGAGIYPPEDIYNKVNQLVPSSEIDDNVKIITKRANGKLVGDPVLDEPIKFNVTVGKWVEAKEPDFDGGIEM